jgi:hypothetical protein
MQEFTMFDTMITIPVDADTARAYQAASPEDQKKMQILLRLRLRELTSLPNVPLRELMDEIGAQAEARGLTPEILETLLQDDE